jgi:hypothetical protein
MGTDSETTNAGVARLSPVIVTIGVQGMRVPPVLHIATNGVAMRARGR